LTPVRLTQQAKADIQRAAAYYDSRSEGWAKNSLIGCLETVEKIEVNPLGYATVIKDVRRANVARFLFALWFRAFSQIP
jgi:hypothetical protein